MISAEHAFAGVCDQRFCIASVQPLTNHRKPYCSWIVQYQLRHQNPLYYQDDRAKAEFEDILRNVPLNVYPVKRSVCHAPPGFSVEFGVRCKCTKPNFELLSTKLINQLAAIKIEIEN